MAKNGARNGRRVFESPNTPINIKKHGMVGQLNYLLYAVHLVCFSMLRYGLVWFGLVWYALVCFGLVWYALVCFGLLWYALVCFDMLWYALVCYGMLWFALVCGGRGGGIKALHFPPPLLFFCIRCFDVLIDEANERVAQKISIPPAATPTPT